VSGYTTTVELETSLEALFGGLPGSGYHFLQLSKYKNFRSLAAGLKGLYRIIDFKLSPCSVCCMFSSG
jgi:hypothetical protein